MIKLLGINCKIIITVLYMCYWDCEAGRRQNKNVIPEDSTKSSKPDTLAVWQADPEFDFRRAFTTKPVKSTKYPKTTRAPPSPKTGKPIIRNRHDWDNHNELHNDQGLSIANSHSNKQKNDNDKPNKYKYGKDKNNREKGHYKNDIQGKPSKAQSGGRQSKLGAHHHRSKLRTHDDHELRSTRMTPLYQPAEEEKKKPRNLREQTPKYLSPFSLLSQMTRIMEDFPDVNATISVLDRTAEYNDLVIVRMTDGKRNRYFRAQESKYIDELPEKKIIFIVHGLSVLGINHLPSMGHEPDFKKLLGYYVRFLSVFDIFLMPMGNPDGYAAVHANTIWNKNMSPQEACIGVAIDRNFDVAWNISKKVSPCSPLFPGKSAFSETESRAIRDVFHFHGHKIISYIHVHSGTYTDTVFKGDAVLYPKGFTAIQSDDDKYIDLKGDLDEAIRNASFQVLSVTVDTLHNWYGPISGSSVDYAATVYGIPYALEFVMQLYEGGDDSDTPMETALNEVWSRIITTTFKSMYKSLRSNNNKKKK